ncbi:MAG: PASTA domain-containing protein [Gemmatimonadota bacterium]|nr:MAG: PASTA domain-containing protein [Gemmatimonadota bacterium]
MPYDSDADKAKPDRALTWQTGWRLWVTSPRHLLVTTAAIVAAGLLIGELVMLLFIFPPQSVATDLARVPDLVGQTAEQARQRVERRRFSYEEAAGIPHTEPEGTVVAQEPLPGQMAPPGSPVRVTLSFGPPQRPVPDVIGLSHEQAEMVLRKSGFEVAVTHVDAGEDVGEAVGTRPGPGTRLELPGSVRLLVSAGERTVLVPDLAVQSLAEAEATLERLGLRLGEVAEDSASLAAPGTVLAQTPASGYEVARGSRVSVTVAVAPVPAVDSTLTPEDTSTALPDTAGARADTMTANRESG